MKSQRSFVDKEPTVITESLLREVSQEPDLTKAINVVLHNRNIEKIQAFDACTNLRTLDLSFNKLSVVEGLSKLVKLQELKLYDNRIVQIQGLTALTALKHLDLTSNRISNVEGLTSLRSLKVLRLAHNRVASLEGLGRAPALEILDVSDNHLRDLTGLSSVSSLKELVVSANHVTSLKGLQRLNSLVELNVAENRLTSLLGLRACRDTLEVLDASYNSITTLEALTEGATRLAELYLSGNYLTSLAGLSTRTPALEGLDLAGNSIQDLDTLISDLTPLSELMSLRLEGNPLQPAYQTKLLKALQNVDIVDRTERSVLGERTDIWVNPEANGEGGSGEADGSSEAFEPSLAEMEDFKRRMGIRSNLPLMGRPGTSGRPASSIVRDSITLNSLRPFSPATSLRPRTASRPATATSRPTTSSGAGPPREIMLHIRPPSSRSCAGARLMTPQQYSEAVVNFKEVVEQYSTALHRVMSDIRRTLNQGMVEAAADLREEGGTSGAAVLPQVPVMPEMPITFSKPNFVAKDSPAAAGITGPPVGKAAALAAAGNKAVAGFERDPKMEDPEVEAAMALYRKLYPTEESRENDDDDDEPSTPNGDIFSPLPGKHRGHPRSSSHDDFEEEVRTPPTPLLPRQTPNQGSPTPNDAPLRFSPPVPPIKGSTLLATGPGRPLSGGGSGRGRAGGLRPRLPAPSAGANPIPTIIHRKTISPVAASPLKITSPDQGVSPEGPEASESGGLTPVSQGGNSPGVGVQSPSGTTPRSRPLSAGRGPRKLMPGFKPRVGGGMLAAANHKE